MNKYPKAVYKSLDNVFENVAGPIVQVDDKLKENGVLKSISAETLAELARDKGEVISITFMAGGAWIDVEEAKETKHYDKKENESLGEFCLRFSKLRNYITEEK